MFPLISSEERVGFRKTWYELDATGELRSTRIYKSQSQIGRLELHTIVYNGEDEIINSVTHHSKENV